MIGFSLLILVVLVLAAVKDGILSKIIFYILFIVLFFLSAFRGLNVGTDTINYLTYFETIKNDLFLNVEPLWIFLNKVVIYLNGDYRDLLVVSSLCVLFPLFYGIKKESSNSVLSLFFYLVLYLYFFSFNITRQYIAVSIVFLGIIFYRKSNSAILYSLFVLVAALFHYSASLMLIVLLAKRIPNKLSFYLIAISISLVFGIFLTDYVLLLANKTGYSNYFLRFEIGNVVGNLIYVLILNAFFVLIYFYCNFRDHLYFRVFFMFIIFSNLLARIPLSNRLVMYLSVIQILVFPMLLKSVPLKHKVFCTIVIVIYGFTIFARNIGHGGIFPYTNIYI